MKPFEIYNLNCTKKENRIKLLKETMSVLKMDSKPDTIYLEKVATSLGKKYKMNLSLIKYKADGSFMVSLESSKGSYSTFDCHSYYEMLCKLVLLAKWKRDYQIECKKI